MPFYFYLIILIVFSNISNIKFFLVYIYIYIYIILSKIKRIKSKVVYNRFIKSIY
jgi:hypothetical protein